MAVFLVQAADGEQRIHALLQGFADADENARGEGDFLASRFFDGAQA